MSILIGADIVPTNSNAELFMSGDAVSLIGKELYSVFAKAEYKIFNLEVPLTDKETPISKQGPRLIAPTSTINGYRALGLNLLTIANNHILDQNDQGLRSTIETLSGAGISFVGAGDNLEDAAKPFAFSFYNKKIGVYACAEHEFSIAGDDKPGANPFDPLWSLDHVARLKAQVDYVIVLYHGGKEHYRYPSPNLQKTCRRLVDKGADLVICQHSHCIGCEEKYKDGTIVYGQGNFLFDNNDIEEWQTGLLVRLNEKLSIDYVPVMKEDNRVRLASEDEAGDILRGFYQRSEEIKDLDFITTQYGKFADSMLDRYLYAFSGKKSVVFRIINKIMRNKLRGYILKRKYGSRQFLSIRNYTECEAHRELLLRACENACIREK